MTDGKTGALKALRPFPAIALLAAALMALPTKAGAQAVLEGPAAVVDGRTLTVAGRAIRLGGIDAPAPAQTCRWSGRTIPCGRIAGDALRDLVTGAVVRCRLAPGTASPPVATCTADGFDIAGNMVYTGWAVTAPDGPDRYRAIQEKARAAKRGLWRGAFVMPSDWRAGGRLP